MLSCNTSGNSFVQVSILRSHVVLAIPVSRIVMLCSGFWVLLVSCRALISCLRALAPWLRAVVSARASDVDVVIVCSQVVLAHTRVMLACSLSLLAIACSALAICSRLMLMCSYFVVSCYCARMRSRYALMLSFCARVHKSYALVLSFCAHLLPKRDICIQDMATSCLAQGRRLVSTARHSRPIGPCLGPTDAYLWSVGRSLESHHAIYVSNGIMSIWPNF